MVSLVLAILGAARTLMRNLIVKT